MATNKRAQHCERCGEIVPAGQGNLYHVDQDWLDDNDDFWTTPGWKVDHSNRQLCDSIRTRKEREQREHEERASKLQSLRAKTADLIQKYGERPTEEQQPDGERVLDTGNIYGGGDWFVIGTDSIWYVRNNGMDGDNWSYNNVRTGGAGAIGWKISMDTDVEDTLRALVAGQTLEEYRHANGLDNYPVDCGVANA